MASTTDSAAAAVFPSFYLQRATREFAEDIDKVRQADDFKPDSSVPFLVHALQQGASLYSEAEQARVMAPPAAEPEAAVTVADAAADEEEEVKDTKKKEKKKEKKSKRKSEGRS